MATFLPPLSHEKLLTWWKERIAEVNDGKRLIWILVKEIDASGRPKGPDVMGVVMLSTPYSETGAFRGYVEKLFVHKNFRGRGGARALMEALENGAANMGRSILVSFCRAARCEAVRCVCRGCCPLLTLGMWGVVA